MSSNVFGFPIVAPSITLTDAAGLVTDAVTADVVTASVKVLTPQVVTPLVVPAGPTAGTGAAGTGLGLTAAAGATSASTAGGKGGDLGLSAGAAGIGTAAANGGSVILRPGDGFAPGVSGVVRVTNGPLLTNGALVSIGAASPTLTVGQLRRGIILGTPGGLVTYTLPVANDILDGFPGIQIDDRIIFSVSNDGTNTITMNGAVAGISPLGTAGSRQITVADHAASFALIATSVTPAAAAFQFLRIG